MKSLTSRTRLRKQTKKQKNNTVSYQRKRSCWGSKASMFCIWCPGDGTAACCASVSLSVLQGSQNSEERHDKNTQRLSHAKHQGLQGEHALPCRLIDSCYGCTSENPSKQRADDAHEQDAEWKKSCHLMPAEGCQSQEGSRQVENQWGDDGPQEHAIPHLRKFAQRGVVPAGGVIRPGHQIQTKDLLDESNLHVLHFSYDQRFDHSWQKYQRRITALER